MTIARQTSRISDAPLVELFSLGDMCLSDFVDDCAGEIKKVPLTMALDGKSGLLQLMHTAPFEKMYENYWYRSGMNKTMTEELKGIAHKTESLIAYEEGDVALDIGCNDGTLLGCYGKNIYRVGFDPAKNLRKYSVKRADMIVTDYFSADTYLQQVNKRAKIITTIAMFYDLEDPNAFVSDIEMVLDQNGLWIIQMSYMPLMLKQRAFDNICHEHLEYYSLSSLRYLLEQHDLKIVDVELNDTNGGSFRIYVRKVGCDDTMFATAPYRDVAAFRTESLNLYEQSLNLNDPVVYTQWFDTLVQLREKTINFIKSEKSKGKTIWGYGASTKGNTLLQWYGLDNMIIDAIAEKNKDKFGLKTPGTNIAIKSESEMRKAAPDYLLVLPWHFISEFTIREAAYLESGGKIIVPLPDFQIISK
ncbi:class I SAM-dependent methyltransferase [Chloroflexota bacterium]